MVVAPLAETNQLQHVFFVQDDAGQREYILTAPHYLIGRHSGCGIHLQSQFVSRLHATLIRFLDNEGRVRYRIVDGDGLQKASANGILVNGNKVSAVVLQTGDIVTFGPQIIARYERRSQRLQTSLKTNPGEEDPFDITLIDPAMMDDEPPLLDDGEESTRLF
ncbi:FHA domain-containing protein [Synechococcus moorigangaii CMS01]|nr:FHA domain-containing protein [Synechococcus moorigangaii CMS01]